MWEVGHKVGKWEILIAYRPGLYRARCKCGFIFDRVYPCELEKSKDALCVASHKTGYVCKDRSLERGPRGSQPLYDKTEPEQQATIIQPVSTTDTITDRWNAFIKDIEKIDDPLLVAVLKAGFPKITLEIVLPEAMYNYDAFAQKILEPKSPIWRSLIQKHFGNVSILIAYDL